MDNHQNIKYQSSTIKNEATEVPVKKERDSSKIYFFIIAIVALLATNVYFYIKFKSSGEKLYTVTIQKEDLQIEIDRIEAELDNLVNFKTDDVASEFVASENRARTIIANLRAKLDNNAISEADIQKARMEVYALKSNVSELRTDLSDLKMRNDLLQRKNSELSQQVEEGDSLISNLHQENKSLKGKITVASGLKVSNIQVNGISIGKKGNIEIETKARRSNKLQIVFNLADNNKEKKGQKEVFVRVIDPSGNLLADANNLFFVHGEKLQYTFKEVIYFTNKGEEYQIYWESAKFSKGAYTILLYADNAIMGRASVVLK